MTERHSEQKHNIKTVTAMPFGRRSVPKMATVDRTTYT